MKLNQAELLIEEFKTVPHDDIIPPTFFEISGYPHYENVSSNMLEFFFDPAKPHGLNDLCLNALLQEIDETTPQSNVSVEREVMTNMGNRLDLLIETDTHIIGIENKIFHSLNNPFADYSSFLKDRNGKQGKKILKVVLLLKAGDSEPGYGFVCVSHSDLIKNIRSHLGFYIKEADYRYLILLNEYMMTMENLIQGSHMNKDWLKFIYENDIHLLELLSQINLFKADLRRKVKELGVLIDARNCENVRQWFWREPNKLCDTLVHDITVTEELTVAVDTKVNAGGWEINFFLRNSSSVDKLRSLLITHDIEFEESNRLIYSKRYHYNEPYNNIKSDLEKLIIKLANSSS